MNYRAALAWLYATQTFGIKLGLENTERLLRALGLDNFIAQSPGSARASRAGFGASPKPLRSAHLIHVAGTNGKGSVCAMADSILRAAGYRNGLFTSPHLVSFRERIRVNGEMISEADVARGLSLIRKLTTDWEPHPTFFEIVTSLALNHFAEANCDVIVLETGMGGRLDATNAVPSSVSVLTPISFDHEKWLGHSLAEIATEKAGIIKSRIPVVSSPQRPEAAAVIAARARACDAPLEIVEEPWRETPTGLAGRHQQMNAALAIAALRASGIELADDVIAPGLATVDWPARFQQWEAKITLDGAHNPSGIATLVEAWREKFGDERATIILAVLADKNAPAMIKLLAPVAARFILPKIRSERAESPAALSELISNQGIDASTAANTAAAINLAKESSEQILIAGSLHFAGEALAVLRGQPNALEDCLQ